MKKQLVLPTILLSLFLLVITSIYYSSAAENNAEIDPEDFLQESVGELKAQQSLGYYKVNPSFRVSLKYNIDDYEVLKTKSLEVIESCNEVRDIEKCVKDKIGSFNSGGWEWSFDCDYKEQKVFNDFVDFIEECRNSVDEGCICKYDDYGNLDGSYEIRTGEEIIQDVLNDVYENNVLVKLFNPDGMEHKIKDITLKYSSENQKIGFGSLTYKLDKGKAQLSFYTELSGVIDEWKNQKEMRLLKNETELMFIKEDDNSYDGLDECKPLRKYYRVCVTNNKYKFTTYNEEKEELEEMPVMYKFALYIADTTPPEKPAGLLVFDTPNAEGNITIEWEASASPDTKEYWVYQSETEFGDVSEMIKIITVLHEEGKEKYNVTIAVEDDMPYFFTVTAVDFNNNEIKEVESKEGKSEDDLAPGPVVNLEVTKGSKPLQVEVKWARPENEEDEVLTYDIYYRLSGEIDLEIPPEIPGVSGNSRTITLPEGGDYLFGVIARDEKGNPTIDFLLKKEDFKFAQETFKVE